MAKVIKEFRDVSNFAKVYKVGDEVEFDKVRLAKLVKIGLVEDEGLKDEKPPVTDIDLSKKWNQVVSDVNSFTDVEKLKAALEIENQSEKPRPSVVDAISERIEELSKQ